MVCMHFCVCSDHSGFSGSRLGEVIYECDLVKALDS